MKTALLFVWEHRTKTLGILQIIVSQIATAGVLSDASVKWWMMISGILTALVGFFNSRKPKDDSGGEMESDQRV